MYQMPFVSTAVRVDHEDGWVVAFNLRDHFAADKGNERKIVYLSTPMEEDPTEVPPGTKKKISWISTPEPKESPEPTKGIFSRLKSKILENRQSASGGKRKSSKKKRTRKSKRNKKSKTRRRR